MTPSSPTTTIRPAARNVNATHRGLAGHITEEDARNEKEPMTFPVAELPDIPNTMHQPIGARSIPRNVPLVAQDVPTIQWANGHTKARATPDERWAPFVGFHAEIGRDEALDELLRATGIPTIEIRHQRPGAFEVKPHWNLGESFSFHPITAGPVATTISGCLRLPERTADAGLGIAWRVGEKSRLAVRGLLTVEHAPGVVSLLLIQLSARSTMTDFLLSALLDHVRACQVADGLIKREQHPEVVALHELALPLKAGPEQSAGKGDATAQIVPFVSGHPSVVDREYVRTHWRKTATHEAALDAWASIAAWATEFAQGEGGE